MLLAENMGIPCPGSNRNGMAVLRAALARMLETMPACRRADDREGALQAARDAVLVAKSFIAPGWKFRDLVVVEVGVMNPCAVNLPRDALSHSGALMSSRTSLNLENNKTIDSSADGCHYDLISSTSPQLYAIWPLGAATRAAASG